jgi:hypothetical protein
MFSTIIKLCIVYKPIHSEDKYFDLEIKKKGDLAVIIDIESRGIHKLLKYLNIVFGLDNF